MLASLAIFFLAFGGIGGSLQPTRIIILFAGLFFGVRKRLQKQYIGLSPLIRKGLIIYLVWILYGLVTLVWAPDALAGLNSEIIVMGIGMSSLLFFPYFYENNILTIKLLCNVWAWGCIFTLPIALFEILTSQHFFYQDEDRILGGLNIDVPFAAVFFGNYNGYSTVLCFYYPFLLITFLTENRTKYKIFFGAAIFITIMVLLINTSRGALLTCALISLCAIKIDIKRILLLIITISALYFLIPSGIRNTIDTVIEYRFGSSDATKDDSRSQLLNAGIQFVVDSYGFGIGAGGFEFDMVNSKYYSGMINPHNIFLEVLSQYGIIIFLLFIYWILILGLNIWKNPSIDGDVKRILLGTIFCIPIIGAINSAALGYTYWWIFLTTLAIIASVNPTFENAELNK